MDININVRAVDGTRRANTSADKQTATKRTRSPMAKKADAKKPGYGNILGKKAIVGAKLAAVAVLKVKTLTALNNIEASVTGNKFRQKARSDLLKTIFNPAGMGSAIIKDSFNQYFDVLRETEKLTYQRDIAGFVMPFRSGNAGITL
jgi:hypothetical protein